jgi:hypothetical protein
LQGAVHSLGGGLASLRLFLYRLAHGAAGVPALMAAASLLGRLAGPGLR